LSQTMKRAWGKLMLSEAKLQVVTNDETIN